MGCTIQTNVYTHTRSHERNHDLKIALDWVTIYKSIKYIKWLFFYSSLKKYRFSLSFAVVSFRFDMQRWIFVSKSFQSSIDEWMRCVWVLIHSIDKWRFCHFDWLGLFSTTSLIFYLTLKLCFSTCFEFLSPTIIDENRWRLLSFIKITLTYTIARRCNFFCA